MFVIGGTPLVDSNRMIEKSTELIQVTDPNVEKEFSAIVKDGDLIEFIEFFDWACYNDIHIVGSRDYVYNSRGMLSMLFNVIDDYLSDFRVFPRTLGFRDKIVSLCNIVDEEDLCTRKY